MVKLVTVVSNVHECLISKLVGGRVVTEYGK